MQAMKLLPINMHKNLVHTNLKEMFQNRKEKSTLLLGEPMSFKLKRSSKMFEILVCSNSYSKPMKNLKSV